MDNNMFLEYGFHPRVQRWVIGQCLCSDQRSLASYGVRQNDDSAFLFLLSARHARLSLQALQQDQESALLLTPPSLPLLTSPSLPPPTPPLNATSANGPSSLDRRPGNICEIRDLANMEMPQLNRALTPNTASTQIRGAGGYRPDDLELRRIQQEKEAVRQYQQAREAERRENFARLVLLDGQELLPNPEPVDCRICYVDLKRGEGVLLRECLHCFCRECLRSVIMLSEEPEVACPYRDDTYSCTCSLQEREIRARGLSVAESRCEGSYHCATPDCAGWCVYEDTVNVFHCPVCTKHNCLICKCGIIVQKRDGCDWLRCTVCHSEICWVTRGPRWGPGGPGDTSGGCRCNVDNQKCHPKCQNCH
ncbi:hypothetical protein F7725_028534 [Dissostichus mawsoni]|uniref:Uncharacterized protein n=1 Tax=Dissostichus mawsoni TaxID=36200 RepID=A0A7J5XFY8_DISMA|nr:hypothetical protein F7725_028534 [Dissostichus mawsoni]